MKIRYMIQQQTSQQYFKSLYILQVSFLVGLLLFSMITVFLKLSGSMIDENHGLNAIFQILVPILVISGFVFGKYLYNKKVTQARHLAELKEKMNEYRGAFIIRAAMLEGPAIFAIVSFMLTGNYLLIALTGLVIVLFIVWLPSKEKVADALQLSLTERAVIDNPDAIIAEAEVKQ